MTPMRFEFRVDGTLTNLARARFVDMRITEAPTQTILDGVVIDESHLHGIIAEFQALGITVVSAHPIPEVVDGGREPGPEAASGPVVRDG